MKDRIKVLIVDDHPVVRRGIVAALSGYKHLAVVGEAGDGHQAIALARTAAPDVVLMDISMPEMDGLAVMQQLRKAAPRARVLALSMYNKKEYIIQIVRAGARGYMLKNASPEELARAIESVHAGQTAFSREVATVGAQGLSGARATEPGPLEQLSPREREVLLLIAEEHSNQAIAEKLGLGVRTVETHRERIMRKLGARSAVDLTKFAIAHGLIRLPTES